MEFSIKSLQPGRTRSGCVVVGVFESRKLSGPSAQLDAAAQGALSTIAKRGDVDGKTGTTLMLHNLAGIAAERVLLVGLGREADFGQRQYREAVAAAMRALNSSGAKDAEFYLTALEPDGLDAQWRVQQAVTVARETLYRFDQMKSRKDAAEPALRRVTLVVDKADARKAGSGLEQGVALAEGMALTKDLGNLPPNVCTPGYLADQARELGKRYRMKVQVLERDDMKKLGMNTLLSVAQGSAEPPKFIVIEYRGGAKAAKPVVLVGKGVTFDTGGISIKPAAEMDEMKYDMSGAGTVLGTMKAIGELKLRLNVVGLIPATENMPGGRATRPGDVVKSMSGQTVEILNTDAEGRLILCDALTYAERYEPAAVIDIATLTGACVIALGHVASGLFSNDDALAQELLGAADRAYDRAWRMPLWDDYQDQLKSNFADFANIGGRPAGSVTAACFLARFARKFKWAHLDIAGTAWRSGKDKGATARPVPMLLQFLLGRVRGA
ncbi:MAG: leucyl aminopeptidase [Betaproteobacteria bacterium]|nr:leucyl aminopeptidase [Betaproteobacteria bacterium]